MLELAGLAERDRPVAREPDFTRAGILLYGAAPMSARGVALIRLEIGARDADRTQAERTRTALAEAARNALMFHVAIHERFSERAAQTESFAALNE